MDDRIEKEKEHESSGTIFLQDELPSPSVNRLGVLCGLQAYLPHPLFFLSLLFSLSHAVSDWFWSQFPQEV